MLSLKVNWFVSLGSDCGVKEKVVRGVRRVIVYMVTMPLGVRGGLKVTVTAVDNIASRAGERTPSGAAGTYMAFRMELLIVITLIVYSIAYTIGFLVKKRFSISRSGNLLPAKNYHFPSHKALMKP